MRVVTDTEENTHTRTYNIAGGEDAAVGAQGGSHNIQTQPHCDQIAPTTPPHLLLRRRLFVCDKDKFERFLHCATEVPEQSGCNNVLNNLEKRTFLDYRRKCLFSHWRHVPPLTNSLATARGKCAKTTRQNAKVFSRFLKCARACAQRREGAKSKCCDS